MRSFIAVALGLLAGNAFAAQQLVPTKTLLVKNPASGARKVLWKVKDTAATIVGDPTLDGASLRIQLTPGGDQCVSMPASGWSAIGTIGFKYKDTALASGPVKVAQIKKTPAGTFLIKVLLKNGGASSIAVTPGNPTASYVTNFTVGTGDEYCGGTGGATPNPDDASTFKVKNDAAPAACIVSCSPPNPLPAECCESNIVDACTWLPPNECILSQGSVGASGSQCDSATGKCVNATPLPGACCDPGTVSPSACVAGPVYAENGCDGITPVVPDSICPSSGGSCVQATTTTTASPVSSSTSTTNFQPCGSMGPGVCGGYCVVGTCTLDGSDCICLATTTSFVTTTTSSTTTSTILVPCGDAAAPSCIGGECPVPGTHCVFDGDAACTCIFTTTTTM